MKKIGALLLISFIGIGLMAQNPDNLVINGSFEELEGKLKEKGAIELAYPWGAETMNPVDLYSSSSKSDEFLVPRNKYGEEKAKTGNNYAGVNFFGYRGKEPRTYLGAQLSVPLEAGRQYCLKFHLSMSDMSKYAVNNIGMYISADPLDALSDANVYLEPQILSVTNRVYNKQFSWEAVCGTYTAKGGEEFIVIGNFAKDEDTEQETVRLSKEFKGRQTYDAYYYVDDVSVIPTDKLSDKDCACDKIAGGKLEVTEYKRFGTDASEKRKAKNTFLVNSDGTNAKNALEAKKEEAKTETTEEEGTVYKKFDSLTKQLEEKKEEVKEKVFSPADVVVYYEDKQFKVPEDANIQKIIVFLKANSGVKIQLEGHSDPSEKEVAMIGKRRAILLWKKLTDSGISKEQVTYIGKEVKELASKDDASQNRRVTISLQ